MKFYCWYDNGTGYYEGPYIENHENWGIAYEKNDIGYGAYISETDEDPNIHCQKCHYMIHKCVCQKGTEK